MRDSATSSSAECGGDHQGHSQQEKVRIVLEGLRAEDSIADLCRKEGIAQNLCYRWSKEFLGGRQEAARG